MNREEHVGVPHRRHAAARDPHRSSAFARLWGDGVGRPASVHVPFTISSVMIVSILFPS